MKVNEIMTKNVVSVAPERPFKTVVEPLVLSGVSAPPVLDESGTVVGIVTEADLTSKEAYGVRGRRTPSLLADVLAAPRWMLRAFGWVASDIMTKKVVTCAPDEDACIATRRMPERGVKCMPVR